MVIISKQAPSFWENIAGAAGEGIAQSLNDLAQSKIEEMQDRRKRASLAKAGLEWLADAPQHLQAPLAQQYLKQQREQQEFDNYQKMQEQRKAARQPEAFASQEMQQPAGNLAALLGMQSQSQMQEQTPWLAEQMKQTGLRPELPGMPQPQQRAETQPARISPTNKIDQQIAAKKQEVNDLASDTEFWKAKNPKLGNASQVKLDAAQNELKSLEKQRSESLNLDFKREQAEYAKGRDLTKDEKDKWQYNKEYIAKSREAAEAHAEEDMILDRMINISEKEETRNPVFLGVLRDLGFDYEGLRNGAETELNKLNLWFLRGGRALFGGKVSNQEMSALLASVPSLLQTPEGRIRLAKQMKLTNSYFKDREKVRREVIKKNNGVPPYELGDAVDDEMEKYNSARAKKFIEGVDVESKPTNVRFVKESQTLPPASQYPNAYMTTPDGKEMKSNGVEWEPI